jgi:hypothetical protein
MEKKKKRGEWMNREKRWWESEECLSFHLETKWVFFVCRNIQIFTAKHPDRSCPLFLSCFIVTDRHSSDLKPALTR